MSEHFTCPHCGEVITIAKTAGFVRELECECGAIWDRKLGWDVTRTHRMERSKLDNSTIFMIYTKKEGGEYHVIRFDPPITNKAFEVLQSIKDTGKFYRHYPDRDDVVEEIYPDYVALLSVDASFYIKRKKEDL